MTLFNYKAYDENGDEVSGIIDTADISTARNILKNKNLAPFEIKKAEAQQTILGSSDSFGLTQQVKFARQMAALLKGGITLTKALSSIENQKAWQKYRTKLVDLREKIEKGQDFSEALKETENLFDAPSLAVIKVGETTGKLDYAFARLSEYLNRQIEHKRRLLTAMAYPAITAVISIGVLSFLMVYLIPTVSKMFSDVNGELPLITQILIFTSATFKKYWIWAILVLICIFLALKYALKIPSFKRNFEYITHKVPILGPFIKGMQLEAWVRNAGMMIKCGVTLLESVKVTKQSTESILQYEALEKIESMLEHGSSFSEALRKTEYFPLFLVQMIEAGEISGELAEMFESSAQELEAENKTATEMFLNTLEPLLIIIMGTVVGAIMIGILLPIYEMNKFI